MLVPKLRFKREDGTNYPEWEEDTIGNCVNVTSCKRVHQSDWTDSGVPFYRAREIVALYNNEPITPLHISIEKYNALSKISGMISSGDLLVTGVGTIGVPYLVKESDKFYFKDGNIIWFQNEEKRALGSFLYYTLSTNEFQTKILQDSGKGTVHTFTIANAKETIIAIPCLEEQQKIANFLSTVDEVIVQSEAEVQNFEQQKKAAMQKIFSQKVRFKREDGTDYPGWEEKVFTDLFKSIPNKDYQVQTKEYKPNGKYRIIDQSQSFIAGYSDLESKVCYQNPCIIFGDHTTILKYVDFPFIVGADGVKTLITNDCYVAKYCFYLLGFNNVKPTGYNRHYSKLKELTLLCSTDIEEQQKIANFLSAYDEAIAYAKQELDKWKELKKGLLQQMFV